MRPTFACLGGDDDALRERLRACDHALVEDAKLRQYVLNPRHPVGRYHTRLFEELLGIHLGNSGVLKEALLAAAAEEDVSLEVATRFGRKFQIRFPLSGPGGEKPGRSGSARHQRTG